MELETEDGLGVVEVEGGGEDVAVKKEPVHGRNERESEVRLRQRGCLLVEVLEAGGKSASVVGLVHVAVAQGEGRALVELGVVGVVLGLVVGGRGASANADERKVCRRH